MILTLIRHTAVDVPQGTCYGFTDVPLKSTFIEEAAQTARHLEGKTFDRVFSSPLSRAKRLAAYCGYAEPTTDDRLKEINFGDWEMKRFDEITDPRLQKWYNDYIHVRATNGESFIDQYERVSAFIDELKQSDDQQVAIFAHGGVLICAQIYAGVITQDEAFSKLTPYGGVIHIEI